MQSERTQGNRIQTIFLKIAKNDKKTDKNIKILQSVIARFLR